jgi:hypothetical protein
MAESLGHTVVSTMDPFLFTVNGVQVTMQQIAYENLNPRRVEKGVQVRGRRWLLFDDRA